MFDPDWMDLGSVSLWTKLTRLTTNIGSIMVVEAFLRHIVKREAKRALLSLVNISYHSALLEKED